LVLLHCLTITLSSWNTFFRSFRKCPG